MKPLTAAKLIELLAKHIEEHGNVGVLASNGDCVVRCWFDDELRYIVVDHR